MTEKTWTPDRRTVVKGIGAALAAPLAAPFVAPALAANSAPIRFAVVAGHKATLKAKLSRAAVSRVKRAGKLKTTATGNPYLAATSALDVRANRDDSHGLYHDESLTALVQRGASFFACNNALRGLATDIAVTYGTATAPVDVVLADLRRHLVPGALLVPAGDAAVNQAQEARFTLFVAAV